MKLKAKDHVSSDDGSDLEDTDDIEKFYAEKASVTGANLLGQHDETDSEHEEVLAFSGSSSESETEDDQYDSNVITMSKDSETDDEDEDIIEWGNRKENFYYRKGGEKELTDEEDLQLEEFESLQQQRKILENIDETEGIFSELKQLQNESFNQETVSAVTYDVSALTEEQKRELVMREAPELQPLINDFLGKHGMLNDVLYPCLSLLKQQSFEGPFTKSVQDLVMFHSYICSLYCLYFAMKAMRETVKNHPLVENILTARKACAQIDSKTKNIVEIASRLIKNPALLPGVFAQTEMQTKPVTVPVHAPTFEENEVVADEVLEKRPAGYDIVKNKGLMPKRKKKLRNPRVKHRRKFRRALIRRRAQVPEIRSRDRPYEGEPTGIKAGLKRSVKLK